MCVATLAMCWAHRGSQLHCEQQSTDSKVSAGQHLQVWLSSHPEVMVCCNAMHMRRASQLIENAAHSTEEDNKTVAATVTCQFTCYDDNSTQIRQTCSFAACEATQQPNNAALKAPAHDAPAAGSAPATTRAHMLLLLLHCCRLRKQCLSSRKCWCLVAAHTRFPTYDMGKRSTQNLCHANTAGAFRRAALSIIRPACLIQCKTACAWSQQQQK